MPKVTVDGLEIELTQGAAASLICALNRDEGLRFHNYLATLTACICGCQTLEAAE